MSKWKRESNIREDKSENREIRSSMLKWEMSEWIAGEESKETPKFEDQQPL